MSLGSDADPSSATWYLQNESRAAGSRPIGSQHEVYKRLAALKRDHTRPALSSTVLTELPPVLDRTARRRRIRELEAAARLLDPDALERDRLLDATHGYAQRLLEELPDRLAYGHNKSAAANIANFPIGDTTHEIQPLIDLLDEAVVRTGILPAHAGHVGYIPGGGIYASALADYLADVTNEYAGVWFAGPGSVEIENIVLAWMAKLVGYPEEAAGNLSSGGSIASLIAVVTAREAAALTPADYERAVMYSTAHGHHCVEKAVYVAGLGQAVQR